MTVTPPFLFFIQMHPSQTTSPISHPVAFVTRGARLRLSTAFIQDSTFLKHLEISSKQ